MRREKTVLDESRRCIEMNKRSCFACTLMRVGKGIERELRVENLYDDIAMLQFKSSADTEMMVRGADGTGCAQRHGAGMSSLSVSYRKGVGHTVLEQQGMLFIFEISIDSPTLVYGHRESHDLVKTLPIRTSTAVYYNVVIVDDVGFQLVVQAAENGELTSLIITGSRPGFLACTLVNAHLIINDGWDSWACTLNMSGYQQCRSFWVAIGRRCVARDGRRDGGGG
ncbi:hypothetical protein F5887DRAFT_917781 [Amanita rubescens]|nr:hypothetical protein F5887DRAFT_917781 [Amanita rubescens]